MDGGAGMKDPYYRWPEAIIPYKISKQFGSKHVNVIAGAMKVKRYTTSGYAKT